MKKGIALMLALIFVIALLGLAYADDSGVIPGAGAKAGAGEKPIFVTANASAGYGAQNQTREMEMEHVYNYTEDGMRSQITLRSQAGPGEGVESEIEMHGYNVSIAPGLGVNFSNSVNGSGLTMKARFADGQEKDVKVLPDVASQTAINKFQSRNVTVVLKQVGNGTNASVVYEASTNKSVMIFGLFRASAMLQARINATNGEVMQYNQPWWYFLAFGGSGNATVLPNETNASVNESSNISANESNNFSNAPTINITTNESMMQMYPALNGNAFLNKSLGMLNTTMDINGQVVAYNTTTNMFRCNNRNFNATHVASYSPGHGLVGGFYDTYVVDCGNFYLVYNPGDAGPRIYGPFSK